MRSSGEKGKRIGFGLALAAGLCLFAIVGIRGDEPDPTVDAQPARPSAEQHRILFEAPSTPSSSTARTERAPTQKAPSTPRAVDSVVLMLSKSFIGETLWVSLQWSGGTTPFTVSQSTDASFQTDVETLAQGTEDTTLDWEADTGAMVEFFEATDAETVSRPAQSIGYDPTPRPVITSLSNYEIWWDQPITAGGQYLDPIPEGNLGLFWDRPAKASSAPGGPPFATSATFTVPCDTRSTQFRVMANGRKSDYSLPMDLNLIARDISIPNITSMTWGVCSEATEKANIWVAGDGKIQEVDLFHKLPADFCTTHLSGLTEPCISRPTNDGKILYVEGFEGVNEIFELNLCTGTPSHYANTHKLTGPPSGRFERDIHPKAIAVEPDGSYCYVADAVDNVVVRFQKQDNGNVVDNWGMRMYPPFPEPCGMDVDYRHYVYVARDDGGYRQIVSNLTTYYINMSMVLGGIQVDREASSDTATRFTYSEIPFTEAYNYNDIEDVDGTQVHYLGGIVFGNTDETLELGYSWPYIMLGHSPKQVILNNAGRVYPYRDSSQTADRVIPMQVQGWKNVPLRLEVADPADFAPYAPANGWPDTYGTPRPPYDVNDNSGQAGVADYGLTTNADGSGAAPNLTLTPTADSPFGFGQADFYLKMPARYSGDNLQVKVIKCDPKDAGNPVPNHVANISSFVTGWKRVFVERDRMFRRGGLLYTDALPGDSTLLLYRLPDDSAWADLEVGDLIGVFDVVAPYEDSPDFAYIGSINELAGNPAPGEPHQMEISLVTERGGATPYYLQGSYTASPVAPDSCPDFSSGSSAAVGVIESADGTIYDTAWNQMNGTGAAFYDADMRSIEETFTDAYVEFIGMADGMGAVPYLPQYWFDNSGDGLAYFSQAWFLNFQSSGMGTPPLSQEQNYFHLVGCSKRTDTLGYSNSGYDVSYVMVQGIIDEGYPPDQTALYFRSTTKHELSHQFSVNPDDCYGHDERQAWCAVTIPAGCTSELCLMNPSRVRTNGIDRLCSQDLVLGAPTNGGPVHCGPPAPFGWDISWNQGEGGIRTMPDPL